MTNIISCKLDLEWRPKRPKFNLLSQINWPLISHFSTTHGCSVIEDFVGTPEMELILLKRGEMK